MTDVVGARGRTATSGPGRRRRFYGWRIVGVLAVTETVSWGILYYAFAVFQVPMRAELGFSAATMAGAFSVAVLVAGAAAVPVGRWLDRHGARGLMTAGSLAATLLVLAWSRVHTVAGLYLVFGGIGLVSAAVLYEPAFAVVVRWFAAGRGRALLAVTVVAGFASTIFLPLSDALIASLGWRNALLVLAGLLAVTTVLPHALVLRRDPADLGLQPDGADRPPGAPPAVTRAPPSGLRHTARVALGDRRFRWLALGFAANTLAVIVVAVNLYPFLREHGHSAAFAAAATGALGALSVTGRLVVTGVTRRRPVAAVTAIAFGLQAGATPAAPGGGGDDRGCGGVRAAVRSRLRRRHHRPPGDARRRLRHARLRHAGGPRRHRADRRQDPRTGLRRCGAHPHGRLHGRVPGRRGGRGRRCGRRGPRRLGTGGRTARSGTVSYRCMHERRPVGNTRPTQLVSIG